jgi:hypothetical protein
MAASTPDEYFSSLPRPLAGVGVMLRALIESELPDATTRMYHAIPVWSVGAEPTVGVKANAKDIALLFFRGQRIVDPTGRLTPNGSFEMASTKLVSADDVDETVIRDWVRQAAAADRD